MSTEGTCVPVNSILKEQVTQFLGRPAVSPTGVSWFVSVGTPNPSKSKFEESWAIYCYPLSLIHQIYQRTTSLSQEY